MAFTEWNAEYSVKIKLFDDQHQGLFKLLDSLYNALHMGKGKSILGNIIDELELYTITHFRDEEEYLQQHNYPKFSSHIAEHKIFTDKIVHFRSELELQNVGLPIAVATFLRDWLTIHIKINDKEYSQFLLEKGIL